MQADPRVEPEDDDTGPPRPRVNFNEGWYKNPASHRHKKPVMAGHRAGHLSRHQPFEQSPITVNRVYRFAAAISTSMKSFSVMPTRPPPRAAGPFTCDSTPS